MSRLLLPDAPTLLLPDVPTLMTPTLEHIYSLRQPVDWKEHMALDTPERIEKKAQLARAIGVPAVFFLKEDVDTRIEEMGLVTHALSASHGELHIGVELGGLPFFSDIMEDTASFLPFTHPDSDTIEVSHYGNSQQAQEAVRISRHLKTQTITAGRKAIFYDDLVDEGGVLRFLDKRFMKGKGYRGKGRSAGVGVTVLADKGIAHLEDDFDPSDILVGFIIANTWASGKGMDGKGNAFRHTPHLLMSPVQDVKYRETTAEALELLGDRAVMTIDQIQWIK